MAVKIENLFAATVALFGAGDRTQKQDFFERPGKNLQISYSFDYVKCAWIMSPWVCTLPGFMFFMFKLDLYFPMFIYWIFKNILKVHIIFISL